MKEIKIKMLKPTKHKKKLQKGIFNILLPVRNCRKNAIIFGSTPILLKVNCFETHPFLNSRHEVFRNFEVINDQLN